ncbi:MAG: putative rane protein [Herbinix sp.]|jgi:ABC-2 type transport system permease protein|nr:putative rane protein [Herbinix sp.]
MKKVLRLVRVQLWAVLGDMLSVGNLKKKKPKALYVGIGFFVILMSAISFIYSLMIGSGLMMFDSLELLPPMMMSVACIILLVTTILQVKGTIFGFKDYDMVMALPISTGGIVASRLIILYSINMIFVTMLMLPMLLAYGMLAQPPILFYAFGIVAMLFVPLVPIVIASIIGTVIAYVASKFRRNNLLSIILIMGFLAVFMAMSFSIEDNGEKLVDMSRTLTAQVYDLYPLAKLYTMAVVEQDVLSFGLFLGVSALAFIAYTILVKAIFKKMNTAIMTGSARSNYKLGRLKTASPMKALYRKELKRYFSSTLYVTNTAFGIVMLTLASVALFFVEPQKLLGEEMPVNMIAGIGPAIISFCVMMCCTTMSSISLEGKNLWIIKSMPVEPKTVYLAKIYVNLTVLSPAVIDAVILGIALKADLLTIILMVLITVVCSVFISFYGLLMNLLLPNFNWSNETVVIKQGAAAMVTIFSSIGIVAIQFVLMVIIPNMTIAYLGYILVMIAIDAGLYAIILSYGKKRYAALT